MNNIPSTSKQVAEDVDIFEDSAILANFDDSSFRDNSTKFSESKINNSANRSGLNVSALCCDEEISGYDKLSGRTWIYPTNYPVRDYQFNIIKAAILKNTLVSLPTGLGKTFIAAVIMYNFYRWYPMGKIVFTAPTRPLVAQQIEACYNIVAIPPNDTVEMTGHMQSSTRKTHWQTKRVFFATPQVIYNDIKSGICPGDRIRCLVIDEAHKARGNYAYCQIVGALTDMGHKTYRILALSATPGSKVEDVVNVVKSLHIAHLELRTESCIDVSPYSHARKINTVIVPIGPELSHLRQQYVEIIDDYARRLKQLGILPHNLGNISKGRVVILYKEFQSKDRSARHPQHNHLMRDFTHLIALFHGLELLVKHGSRVFLNFFDEHPEKSWIQSDDRLTALLERLRDDLGVNPLGLNTSVLPDGTVPEVPKNLCFGHPKFDKLKAIMVDHFTRAKDKKQDTRAIVFCEYRESVNLVHCLLLQCRPLIIPQTFVGQGSSGKDGKAATSQKQQLRVMKNFREGLCNTLVATCVAEEGLDVGSVDLIICFDISTRSPIRLVQRCGRTGRERGGQVHILVTEGREHQTLLDCMRQRDGLNKKILNSRDVQAALYASNPRLVPHDFVPTCQKMHITVAKKDTNEGNKKNKDLRTMLLGRASSSSSNSSNKDLDAVNVISEQEFNTLYPEGFPYTTPLDDPLELWAKNKETIIEMSTSDNVAITNHSAWLEWQQALQNTINIGHSVDTEILTSLLQFSDAKKCQQPLNTQRPTELGIITQDFASQKFLPSPSKIASPVKLSSPAKTKQTKKKQNLPIFKSPGKKDGDIRALFSTATKSTKNYTKLINDLGIQNDGSISTKLINLLVDLTVSNTTAKPCYICENVCECAFLIDLKKDRRKPNVAMFSIEEIKLPDIDLIDEIDAHAILKCAKTDDSNVFDYSNGDIQNVSYLDVVNKKESNNFDLEFDFEAIGFMSPDNKNDGGEKEVIKDDLNFDVGDIEDVFDTSSPEEVVAKETKSEDNPKQALGFFGLDSIDDIFADSDDEVSLECSKTFKTPEKLLTNHNPIQNENKTNVGENKNNELNSIEEVGCDKEERLSPSLLSGNVKQNKSPVLCSQVRKFKLSTKKKQSESSTPQNTNTSKRQLISDLTNNKNVSVNKDITKYNPRSSLIDSTNRSMFTITQLVDMINKTDTNVSKEVTIIDDDERCLSPILLTQADKKKATNNNNSNTIYDKSINLDNNTDISNNSKSKSFQKHSLIILESDESESENDNTQVYDLNEGLDHSFTHIVETPKKQESSKLSLCKKLDASKPGLKIDDLDDVPNIENSILNETNNKRKVEAIDDVITASPFFHKKPKLQLESEANKKATLQEKVLAALSKKSDKFNNDTNINYVLSPNKVFSQKENLNPLSQEKNKQFDEEEYVRKRNLEMLKIFRKDRKVLSPKKLFESMLNASRTQMSQKRKLAFDDSDDDFDDEKINRKQKTHGHKKPVKNRKVRKKKHKPNEFLDLEAEMSDSDSGDELTDDSAGSIAEFICDENLTQREDMHAVYMKSVKSPVKGVFKIPVLPTKYNNEEIFSQFVEEDNYEMDSFCVDGNMGLTQVHDYSELELAEMLLEEKKRKNPKRNKNSKQKTEENNGESPIIARKKRTVNRIESDSDDSS